MQYSGLVYMRPRLVTPPLVRDLPMDFTAQKDHFKKVLSELLMAANNSTRTDGSTTSNSIITKAADSDSDNSLSKAQTRENSETVLQLGGSSTASMQHAVSNPTEHPERSPADATCPEHLHQKQSHDSLYTITDAGSPGGADKEATMSAPTTENLGPQGERATYRIAHYHGVALDPSSTLRTKDIGQTWRTDTKATSEDTSPRRLDSITSGADEHEREAKAAKVFNGNASHDTSLRTTTMNSEVALEDPPVLPPRPSALTSQTPRQTSHEQTSQVLNSFNESGIPLSPSNIPQHTRGQVEPIPLSSAHVQTLVPRRSPKHSDIPRIDSSPRHQHSPSLIDLDLQNRLWLAVQQNRVSDARFLLRRGAITDLICGAPTSRDLPQTPLCRAAANNSFELMALLLHHKADPNLVVPGSLPAFRYACWAYVQNSRCSLEGVTMLVDHGARVDVIEIPVFLRMIEEVYPPGSKEVTLPARVFEALSFILKKSPSPEKWMHMALDACSETPRHDVTTWLKQNVKFDSSDRAVKCVARIIALPRSWQFRRVGLEMVLGMGVTETDVFKAVELIESAGITQIITEEQKSDLSKVLWDTRDGPTASQVATTRQPQEQIEDFFGIFPTGPHRDANAGVPFSAVHHRTSVSSATVQNRSSALPSTSRRDPFGRLTRNWSTKMTIPFRSQKNND